MTEQESLLVGVGPSLDDQPFVTSGNPNPLPIGEVSETDSEKWHYLKVSYIDDHGKAVTGYAYPVGANASTSFWDYVVLGAGGLAKAP